MENITEKEKGAPIIIPPKRRERLTPILVIKRLTQNSAKQTIDPLGTICSSDPSAGINFVQFDKFVNSLAKIFGQPTTTSISLMSLLLCNKDGSSNPRVDFIFARQRLSLILPIDFHVLFNPAKSKEVVNLATMLQKDTTLSAKQVAMLKLIEEIPLLGKDILEIKELARQVKVFFFNLESNFLKAASLWKEYKKSKEKFETLRAEVDLDVAALQTFDEGIKNLNARYSILVCSLEMKRKTMVELKSSLKETLEKINKVGNDIRVANTMKEEWEEKKKLLIDRCKTILAKFTPLNGLNFKPFQFEVC